MKKAVVIGGSNGIGLAISRQLIEKGYYTEILDRNEGDIHLLTSESYQYTYCDLLDLDMDLIQSFADDRDVKALMITAGIGRVAEFEYFHPAEIQKTFEINAVSIIKILRIFYERIQDENDFYTGVMGSIAGWMSSPCAAVYAGSKAGLVRFVESVNIELEAKGSQNRILDVSPASFKGSRFYGGENQIEQLEGLAVEIVKHLFDRDTRYIPQYEEIFQNVLENYHTDPHAYGLHSYQYKMESDRIDNHKRVVIGYLSGTFDLFHVGHLNLLRRAKQHCDYLIVGVHRSGSWKGKETFIPFEERMAIVGACQYVDKVTESFTEDSDAWDKWHYDRLFVGSDYKGTPRFERYEEYFKDKNVEIVYFPYTQSTNSTQIRNLIIQKNKKESS